MNLRSASGRPFISISFACYTQALPNPIPHCQRSWTGGELPFICRSWKLIVMPHRYRSTPGFGRDTIRKFSVNASEMKRLAARDYEDLLQVGCCSSLLGELLLTTLSSVLSRHLNRSFQANTITTCSHFFTSALSGMH